MKPKIGSDRVMGTLESAVSWSEVQVAWGSSKVLLASKVRAVFLGDHALLTCGVCINSRWLVSELYCSMLVGV